MDDYSSDFVDENRNFFMRLHPGLRAALIFCLPFMFVDFFNYYSAGTVLLISAPILFLLYAGCGALAARFTAGDGRGRSEYIPSGAFAGLSLWAASTLVNTIISLILGTASLGITLVLGIPYLCCCAPFNLVLGGAAGAFGSWIYKITAGRSTDNIVF